MPTTIVPTTPMSELEQLESQCSHAQMVKMQQMVRVTCLEVMGTPPQQIEAYKAEVIELQTLVRGYLSEVQQLRTTLESKGKTPDWPTLLGQSSIATTPTSPSTVSLASVPPSPPHAATLTPSFAIEPTKAWYEHKPLPRFAVRLQTEAGDDQLDGVTLRVSLLNGRGVAEESKASGTGALLGGERRAVLHDGLAVWEGLRVLEPSSKHYGSFTLVVSACDAPEGVGVAELRSEPLTVQVGRMWSKRRKTEDELSPADPISQIPGVGVRYVSRLQLHGLSSIGQFAAMAGTDEGRDKLIRLCKGDNPRNSLNAAKLDGMIEAARKVMRATASDDGGGKRSRVAGGGDAVGEPPAAPVQPLDAEYPELDETALGSVLDPTFTMEELMMLASTEGDGPPPTPTLEPLCAATDAPAFDEAGVGGLEPFGDDLELRMRRLDVSSAEAVHPSFEPAQISILPPKPGATTGDGIGILPPKDAAAPEGLAGFDALGGTGAPRLPPLAPGPPRVARLFRDAWRGDARAVDAATDAADAAAVDRFGCVPLHAAALGGSAGAVATLLALPAAPPADARARGLGDATPLHLSACRGPRADGASLALLDAGARADASLSGGVTAAHLAAWSGAAALLSHLASPATLATLDQVSEAGLAALEYAALGGQAECVRTLLDAGVACRDDAPLPALHCAAVGGCDETLRLLLDKCPGQLTQPSSAGWLPVHCAAAADGASAIRALGAAGCDVEAGTADEHGMSALEIAAVGGHSEAAGALLELGARPSRACLAYASASCDEQTLALVRRAAREAGIDVAGAAVDELAAAAWRARGEVAEGVRSLLR